MKCISKLLIPLSISTLGGKNKFHFSCSYLTNIYHHSFFSYCPGIITNDNYIDTLLMKQREKKFILLVMSIRKTI